MEGIASALPCEVAYESCTHYPDLALSVEATCTEVRAYCGELDQSVCEGALDANGAGTMSYYKFAAFVTCLQLTETVYPCAEGFNYCVTML
jgi:hypothetical protein